MVRASHPQADSIHKKLAYDHSYVPTRWSSLSPTPSAPSVCLPAGG